MMVERKLKLPEGWVEAKIGSLCEAVNGRAFKSTEWRDSGVPIIRIQNLKDPTAPFWACPGSVDTQVRLLASARGDVRTQWD